MLQRGLRGQVWARLSDWEIRRKTVSYTVDTAKEWAQRCPKAVLFWIMGSDQWEALASWKEPQQLRRRLRFLVFPRPQKPRLRRGFWMREIPVRIDISATDIRERLRKKQSIHGMVLPEVEKALRQKRWYR
jgi:nicotinate-nucleotide adenylyltransferase